MPSSLAGADRYLGGSGNDVMDAVNGSVESIDCASGRDTVRARRRDTRCERGFPPDRVGWPGHRSPRLPQIPA